MNVTQITEFNQRWKSLWDNYVLNHNNGTFYHLSGWKSVIETSYHLPAQFWLCQDADERVIGLLPTINVKNFILGNSLVSMPYLDGGGILAEGSESQQNLLNMAINFALTKKIPLLEFRNLSAELPPNIFMVDSGVSSQEKVSMILPLPENSDILFKSLKSKIRSQIRRPTKEGLNFCWGGLEILDHFYKVFAINMRDLGSPVHSKAFFSHVIRTFNDICRIGVVYLGFQPVASGIVFFFRNTVSVPWASSLRPYNHMAPNMLLYWEFLKHAANSGYKFFEFGRSSKDSGTYRFKEQWGSKPHAVKWQYMKLKDGKTSSETKAALSIFAKAWQRLPLWISLIMGPRIRKYLSM